MTPYNLALLFFGHCTFFLSLLVYLKRQDAIGRYYFLFSCFVAVWAFAFSIVISTNVTPETALFACRLCDLSAVFIAVTWLHFTIVYDGDVVKKKWILVFFYICSIMIAAISFSDLFIPRTQSVVGFRHYPYPGGAFHFFTLLFFTQVTMGFFYLKRKFDSAQIKEERTQVLGFMIATGTGFLGGGLTFLPVYGAALPQYNLFMMPFYPFLMAYFIMRRNLFSEENMVMAAHRDKLAAIGTLATSINHEIKNPLYVIQGISESFILNLKEGVYGSSEIIQQESADAMMRMKEQATRAVDIMRKFSAFAKKDAGAGAMPEVISVQEVLAGMLPLVNRELELYKIRLEVELAQNLPRIRVDARQMEEVFFNLIVNACQALKPCGGGIVRVTGEAVQEGVRITITDNGPGIPKEDLKKIFEPFYTTRSEGTGLGLYITKQLVERNAGKILVRSEIGTGTTFMLEFRE